MEKSGSVKRITYHNESNGYSVFTLTDSKGMDITCVGFIEPIETGDYLVVSGNIETHPTYGDQLKADFIRREIPSDVSMFADYLSNSINGVGPVMAKRIVQTFGDKTFWIIEHEPDELIKVPGISNRKAEKIYTDFLEKNMSRDEQMLFIQLGISMNYAAKIKKAYGNDVKKVLYTNPYQLIDDITGIGFIKADEIAERAKISKDSMFRVKHGVLYLMESYATVEGHTIYPENELVYKAADLLNVDNGLVEKAISLLIDDKKLIRDNEYVSLSLYYHIETKVASKLKSILGNNEKAIDKDVVMDNIKTIEKQKNIELDETQRLAVYGAIANGVIIITGGPGTGKTTTLDVLITYLEKYEGLDISLAAPTGRAAKRMTEQTGREAQTIHRLIGVQAQINENIEEERKNPVLDDLDDTVVESDAIVIDEMSMVDITLLYLLLKHMSEDTKFIMVGDVDQLPSVGPGKVLKDLIESNCVPVAKLRKIHRQAEESSIIQNAHKINAGEKIELTDDKEDFIFLEREKADEIIGAMTVLMTRNLPNHFKIKPTDVQILTPSRKGTLGVENLNVVFQNIINPKSASKNEIKYNNTIFREGDKVMHIKNDYNMIWKLKNEIGVGVFNGDVGFITEIDVNDKVTYVQFEDGRVAEYEEEKLKELTLSYAITIHKSQGSEYPAIIIPLLNGGPPMLYNRNLLYTGVTRAKDCVIIIGKKKNVYSMISNTKIQKRYTGLADKLKNV